MVERNNIEEMLAEGDETSLEQLVRDGLDALEELYNEDELREELQHTRRHYHQLLATKYGVNKGGDWSEYADE